VTSLCFMFISTLNKDGISTFGFPSRAAGIVQAVQA
jgi:hypothetical protein